jgi:hypothetical protein
MNTIMPTENLLYKLTRTSRPIHLFLGDPFSSPSFVGSKEVSRWVSLEEWKVILNTRQVDCFAHFRITPPLPEEGGQQFILLIAPAEDSRTTSHAGKSTNRTKLTNDADLPRYEKEPA